MYNSVTHKISKTENNKYVALFEGNEVGTSEYATVREVAEVVDNYYYSLYGNSGYTTTFTYREYKRQPKGTGIVGSVTVKIIEL